MPQLQLYMSPACGFCHIVTRAAKRLDVPLTLIDIWREPGAREALIAERGRATVPVLVIPEGDGHRLLPESRDIVAFLEEHAETYRAG